MAQYYLYTGYGTFGGLRVVTTFGAHPRPKQDPWQKIARKKVPAGQWAQLEAISKGTCVNHLGKRHYPRER